ncbi:uncharacterized protein PSFLO_04871 [Pseudozyma flocculosa]|uniref:Uncharacterized protein n=1 Tax=Pseudozyma flocculosa TaxID=84751 RepID=A0A5C3F5J8_9BASI|nr:uncharacterized protein PSFLO_04871 [Pseudozyma flocculosa]
MYLAHQRGRQWRPTGRAGHARRSTLIPVQDQAGHGRPACLAGLGNGLSTGMPCLPGHARVPRTFVSVVPDACRLLAVLGDRRGASLGVEAVELLLLSQILQQTSKQAAGRCSTTYEVHAMGRRVGSATESGVRVRPAVASSSAPHIRPARGTVRAGAASTNAAMAGTQPGVVRGIRLHTYAHRRGSGSCRGQQQQKRQAEGGLSTEDLHAACMRTPSGDLAWPGRGACCPFGLCAVHLNRALSPFDLARTCRLRPSTREPKQPTPCPVQARYPTSSLALSISHRSLCNSSSPLTPAPFTIPSRIGPFRPLPYPSLLPSPRQYLAPSNVLFSVSIPPNPPALLARNPNSCSRLTLSCDL